MAMKNNLVLAFLVVAVVACGSDVAARTNQTTITPLVTPTAVPVATATPEIAAATLGTCIDALVTALLGHHHNPRSEGRIWESTYDSTKTIYGGTERELAALLEPCD